MDIKLIRKNIRLKYFDTLGLVLIFVLGLIGLFFSIPYFWYLFNNVLIVSDQRPDFLLFFAIFGLFFFFVSCYVFILFIKNIIIYPKEDILYFYTDQVYGPIFVNRHGKKIKNESGKKIEEKGYYKVLRTNDYIYVILDKTEAYWKFLKKESFWLNFYSPFGNFKDIFLLPIVYVILLPGVLSFIAANGTDKIYAVIYSAVPLYLIVYDLVYKIKLKRNGYVDEIKFKISYDILIKVVFLIIALCLYIGLIVLFTKLADSTSKIIFLPFLSCGCCIGNIIVAKVFNKDKIVKIFTYIAFAIVLIFILTMFVLFFISILTQK